MVIHYPLKFFGGEAGVGVLRNTTRVTRNTHTHTTLSKNERGVRMHPPKDTATANRTAVDGRIYAAGSNKGIVGRYLVPHPSDYEVVPSCHSRGVQ